MFGLLTKAQKKTSKSARSKRKSSILTLECLEERECPSASNPVLTMTATYGLNQSVTLSGSVADAQPAGLTVDFSGAVNGSAITDSNGNFSYTTTAGTGTFEAETTDSQGLTSNMVMLSVPSQSPPASNPVLTMTATYGLNQSVTLSGSVADAQPAGLTVDFSGAVNGSAITDSNGNFSYTTTAGTGTFEAETTDSQGLTSNMVMLSVPSQSPPASNPVLTMTATYGLNQSVTLSGSVADAQAAGLTVDFSGAVNGSAITDSNGNFSYTTTAGTGAFEAETTDSQGLTSNVVTLSVPSPSQSGPPASAPAITSFQAVYVQAQTWTFSGQVTDQNPAGIQVAFGGLPSLSGETATTNSTGEFSVTLRSNQVKPAMRRRKRPTPPAPPRIWQPRWSMPTRP